MEFLTKKLREIMPIPFFFFKYYALSLLYYNCTFFWKEKSQITIIMWIINFDFQLIIRENLKIILRLIHTLNTIYSYSLRQKIKIIIWNSNRNLHLLCTQFCYLVSSFYFFFYQKFNYFTTNYNVIWPRFDIVIQFLHSTKFLSILLSIQIRRKRFLNHLDSQINHFVQSQFQSYPEDLPN